MQPAAQSLNGAACSDASFAGTILEANFHRLANPNNGPNLCWDDYIAALFAMISLGCNVSNLGQTSMRILPASPNGGIDSLGTLGFDGVARRFWTHRAGLNSERQYNLHLERKRATSWF